MRLKAFFLLLVSALVFSFCGCGGGGGGSDSPDKKFVLTGPATLPPEVRSFIDANEAGPLNATLSASASPSSPLGRWTSQCVADPENTGGFVVYLVNLDNVGWGGMLNGLVAQFKFTDARCTQQAQVTYYLLRASRQVNALPVQPVGTSFPGEVDRWWLALVDQNLTVVHSFTVSIGFLPGAGSALLQYGDAVWPDASSLLVVRI